MKKTITALTFAVVMLFGATFSFGAGGIIISDKAGIIISDKASTATTNTADTCREGIIVFGRNGIIVFGVTIGDDPCSQGSGSSNGTSRESTGIIVFG